MLLSASAIHVDGNVETVAATIAVAVSAVDVGRNGRRVAAAANVGRGDGRVHVASGLWSIRLVSFAWLRLLGLHWILVQWFLVLRHGWMQVQRTVLCFKRKSI